MFGSIDIKEQILDIFSKKSMQGDHKDCGFLSAGPLPGGRRQDGCWIFAFLCQQAAHIDPGPLLLTPFCYLAATPFHQIGFFFLL